jgi:hypothetical protein
MRKIEEMSAYYALVRVFTNHKPKIEFLFVETRTGALENRQEMKTKRFIMIEVNEPD